MTPFCFKNFDEVYVLNIDEVVYIKADDHYSEVVYANGLTFMLPYGIGKIEEALAGNTDVTYRLVRFGRKYIVNLDRILCISSSKQNVVLTDDKGNKHTLRISKVVLRNYIDEAKRNGWP